VASILIIDDDTEDIRERVEEALGSSGHALHPVKPESVFAVLEAINRIKPVLVITSLSEAGCPTRSLIRICHEEPSLRRLNFILLTGQGDEELAQFLQVIGNTHLLTRPVTPEALAGCVERLVQGGAELDPGWELNCRGVVALVDDSRLSQGYHAACLRKHGFRPVKIEPTELLETVEAVERARPEVLLVDLMMPRFRGDALVRALRGRPWGARLPMVMVTAHHLDEIEAMLLNLQVDVLHKPVVAEELIEHVNSLLFDPRTSPR
jgi:CheY-like chemotaxis protein